MTPQEAVVRAFFEAGERRDIATIRDCWTDDVVLRYPGRNPVSGEYRGKDQVLGAYAKMGQITGGTFRRIELHDLLASDDHVVALAVVGATRKGKSMQWRGIDVYHIRDGKIAEIWITLPDQQAVDEFLNG